MSNRYIFIYASVMVIIVAAILSLVSTALKPYQEANIRIAKMSDILTSVNIESNSEDAESKYTEYIVKEIAVNPQGEIVSTYENGQFSAGSEIRPFEINLKTEISKAEDGKDAALPIYICNKDGETYYIVPLLGKGLWGPVWGNMALKDDFRTVLGVTFGHKGETPGLGAEIDKPFFQVQFKDKTIFDENYNFTSVEIIKGGVKNLSDPAKVAHSVDAISGGTITSVGVSDMIRDCLTNYIEFFKAQLDNE